MIQDIFTAYFQLIPYEFFEMVMVLVFIFNFLYLLISKWDMV